MKTSEVKKAGDRPIYDQNVRIFKWLPTKLSEIGIFLSEFSITLSIDKNVIFSIQNSTLHKMHFDHLRTPKSIQVIDVNNMEKMHKYVVKQNTFNLIPYDKL